MENIDISLPRSGDFLKAVIVVPLDAPVPADLDGGELAKGSLYERLAPLNVVDHDEFVLCPLAGDELLALERAWPSLQRAKHVYVMTGLPAARYDVLFTQAVRQIGLRQLDWTQVSEDLAAHKREAQRRKDAEPWSVPVQEQTSRPLRSGLKSPSSLPPPSEDEVDVDAN